jgi:hypothetical protein
MVSVVLYCMAAIWTVREHFPELKQEISKNYLSTGIMTKNIYSMHALRFVYFVLIILEFRNLPIKLSFRTIYRRTL